MEPRRPGLTVALLLRPSYICRCKWKAGADQSVEREWIVIIGYYIGYTTIHDSGVFLVSVYSFYIIGYEFVWKWDSPKWWLKEGNYTCLDSICSDIPIYIYIIIVAYWALNGKYDLILISVCFQVSYQQPLCFQNRGYNEQLCMQWWCFKDCAYFNGNICFNDIIVYVWSIFCSVV